MVGLVRVKRMAEKTQQSTLDEGDEDGHVGRRLAGRREVEEEI